MFEGRHVIQYTTNESGTRTSGRQLYICVLSSLTQWEQPECPQVGNGQRKGSVWLPWNITILGSLLQWKRHHDHANSHEGKYFIEVVAYRSGVQSIIFMVGSMAVCRMTGTGYILTRGNNRKWTVTLNEA